jgi:hypothetical protein
MLYIGNSLKATVAFSSMFNHSKTADMCFALTKFISRSIAVCFAGSLYVGNKLLWIAKHRRWDNDELDVEAIWYTDVNFIENDVPGVWLSLVHVTPNLWLP